MSDDITIAQQRYLELVAETLESISDEKFLIQYAECEQNIGLTIEEYLND